MWFRSVTVQFYACMNKQKCREDGFWNGWKLVLALSQFFVGCIKGGMSSFPHWRCHLRLEDSSRGRCTRVQSWIRYKLKSAPQEDSCTGQNSASLLVKKCCRRTKNKDFFLPIWARLDDCKKSKIKERFVLFCLIFSPFVLIYFQLCEVKKISSTSQIIATVICVKVLEIDLLSSRTSHCFVNYPWLRFLILARILHA